MSAWKINLSFAAAGALVGALLALVVTQWFWIEWSDLLNFVMAVTAVSAVLVALKWRAEAIERRKADIAIRILAATLEYIGSIRRSWTTHTLSASDEKAIREYRYCETLVALFFRDLLKDYKRLDDDQQLFTNENSAPKDIGSATLDEIEAALCAELGAEALLGGIAPLPLTLARKIRVWDETGSYPADPDGTAD
jgi:hypothetical protein